MRRSSILRRITTWIASPWSKSSALAAKRSSSRANHVSNVKKISPRTTARLALSMTTRGREDYCTIAQIVICVIKVPHLNTITAKSASAASIKVLTEVIINVKTSD